MTTTAIGGGESNQPYQAENSPPSPRTKISPAMADYLFELIQTHQKPKSQEQLNLEAARKELGVRGLGAPKEESFRSKCKGVVFIAIPVIVGIGAILGIILPLYYGNII